MKNVEIENILFRLNNNIDEFNCLNGVNNFELLTNFTYVTAGYYASINYGNEVLWDSENEPREWIEEEEGYEDLENFIKVRFNELVNTLKKVRFSDVKTQEYKNDEAFDCALEIIENLTNRSLGIDSLDNEIQDEIFQNLVTIIEKYN